MKYLHYILKNKYNYFISQREKHNIFDLHQCHYWMYCLFSECHLMNPGITIASEVTICRLLAKIHATGS